MHRNATHLITSARDDKALQAVLPDGTYPIFIVSPFTERTFMFFVNGETNNALNELEAIMNEYAIGLIEGYNGDWQNDETGDTSQAIFAFKIGGSSLFNITPQLKTVNKRKLFMLNDGTIKGERVEIAPKQWTTISPDDMEPV